MDYIHTKYTPMPKRALLIGCNYAATPSVQLSGCINDIVNVRETLVDAYGYQDANIYVLRDDDNNRLPTKANILYCLTQLVAVSSASDILWVHYSGHGTQVPDLNGDESDNLDECIVPCDYSKSGFITDDDLFAIIKNAKCKMMIMLDSCHSGTGIDLQNSINYNAGVLTRTTNTSKSIANSNIIMISGCQDSQTSADAYDNGSKRSVGAFTQTLLETLRTYDHNVALLPLYVSLCANLRAYGFTQIPALSSTVASPSFQFARANANSTSIVGTSVSGSAAKDFTLYETPVTSSPATKPLRGLMTNLISSAR